MTIDTLLENGTLRYEHMFPSAKPLLTNAPQGQAMCVTCGHWRTYWNFPNGTNGECEYCYRNQHGIELCAWCGETFTLSASQRVRWRKGLSVHCSRSHACKAMYYR